MVRKIRYSPAPSLLARREGRLGYPLIAPTTTLLSIFYLLPLAHTVLYSFTDWNPAGFSAAHPVGLSNYARIFTDAEFLNAVLVTVVLVATVVPLSLASGLVLAAMMRSPFRGRSAVRAILFLPFIAPTVGSALVFTYLLTPFGGLANAPLQLFGLPPVPFLNAAPWSLVAIVLFTVWSQVGFTMIIYSSALAVIPESYYEAATLDGAGPFRQFRSISWPLVGPTTTFLTVTGTLGALQAFTQIHVLTRGGPAGSSTTVLYWIYEQGFVRFDGGAATAGAVVLLLAGLMIASVQLKLSTRRDAVEMQ
ncbi:carbohydrate ABC transporter permease [Microbacterium sp. 1.5R]|uniref:carbohydrate ABC transporter permease n=1 Tax=Microbacterium sp. 1.5R TaxID=1916917 RepID=UPI0011A253C7|nr:sugar ABC transporter permease [Microbacterium sp. 1.5R]